MIQNTVETRKFELRLVEIFATCVLVRETCKRNVSLTHQNKFGGEKLIHFLKLSFSGLFIFVYLPMTRTTDNSK